MAIRNYLREIGRGKNGARSLSREQACDLMGQVLDGQVGDLELGAFCIGMRVKGESVDEMLGFLDAARARTTLVPASDPAWVVLPSYNGARRLPLLTPLLALLLARAGVRVLVHHHASEDSRLGVAEVFAALHVKESKTIAEIEESTTAHCRLSSISPALARLLDVRRTLGLRNSAHSLVKLLNPCAGPAVVVGSYTHPEYATLMASVFERSKARALLLRGTEGEPVADARRMPAMDAFANGRRWQLQSAQAGSVEAAEGATQPVNLNATQTAERIQEMLADQRPVPPPIAAQVEHILRLAKVSDN